MIKQFFSAALVKAGKLRPKSKRAKLTAIALLCMIVAGAAIGGYFWHQATIWPDFPTVNVQQNSDASDTDHSGTDHSGDAQQNAVDPLAPGVMVKIDRDYAYRTGDLVKLTVYFKQLPGTTIDPQSLSLSDTFELAHKAVVDKKVIKDGSTVYRFSLTLQSFVVARDLTFGGSIGWKENGQSKDLTLPETHIFTSNTYDGRKNLMEGPDPKVSIYWYGARYVLPMAAMVLLYLLLLIPAVRAYLRSRIKAVVIDQARLRVVDLVAKIQDGSLSQAEHLELDGLVRERFKIGPVPASQLETKIVPPSLIEFLKLNEPAIYSKDALDDKARAQLMAKAKTILGRWK